MHKFRNVNRGGPTCGQGGDDSLGLRRLEGTCLDGQRFLLGGEIKARHVPDTPCEVPTNGGRDNDSSKFPMISFHRNWKYTWSCHRRSKALHIL